MRSDLWKRWGWCLPLFAGLLAIAPAMHRDFWFDEALTILNFALMEDPAVIYRNYVIPNNQIVHTVLVHFLLGFVPEGASWNVWLRLLPAVCASGLLLWLWFRFRTRMGSGVMLVVLTLFALAPVFAIYGTALRGYMLSALLLLAALDCAMAAARSGKPAAWCGWFLTSFLAVGTLPTNLAGLGCAVVWVLPLFGWDFWKKGRFWALALIPFAAFGIFYLPILQQFLGCCKLREGWDNGILALMVTYSAFAAAFAPVLLPALLGGAVSVRGRKRKIFAFRMLVLAAPVPACLLLPVAPFPRVFVTLWPFWVLLLGAGMRHLTAHQVRLHRRWKRGMLTGGLLAAALIWGGIFSAPEWRERFSELSGGAGSDDVWAPYYMRMNFVPSETVSEIGKMGAVPAIYCSFASDPWSLMLHGALSGVQGWCFDGPQGRVGELLPGSLAILRSDEDPSVLTERFGMTWTEQFRSGRNTVYRAK
ncbi:MAG: hypothetical protein J6R85_06540 [Lentisphaeria bacterium]|nr:hypothetical protein [Lentisphaeria bacterium]